MPIQILVERPYNCFRLMATRHLSVKAQTSADVNTKAVRPNLKFAHTCGVIGTNSATARNKIVERVDIRTMDVVVHFVRHTVLNS